nr:hypothetical protein [Tanacetum cinerariifolium]
MMTKGILPMLIGNIILAFVLYNWKKKKRSKLKMEDNPCLKDFLMLSEAATSKDAYLAYQQLKNDEQFLHICIFLIGAAKAEVSGSLQHEYSFGDFYDVIIVSEMVATCGMIESMIKNRNEMVERCVESKNNRIERLTKELEELKKEKEGLDTKLIGFQSALKDLDNLIGSQRSNKNKEGLGYSDVPSPPAQVYSPLKKDMSWTGLPEFANDTITDYSRPSPTIESNSDDLQNRNSFLLRLENHQRVKRLERELKARTPPIKIQKVDRGRSRSVMAWVPKKV